MRVFELVVLPLIVVTAAITAATTTNENNSLVVMNEQVNQEHHILEKRGKKEKDMIILKPHDVDLDFKTVTYQQKRGPFGILGKKKKEKQVIIASSPDPDRQLFAETIKSKSGRNYVKIFDPASRRRRRPSRTSSSYLDDDEDELLEEFKRQYEKHNYHNKKRTGLFRSKRYSSKGLSRQYTTNYNFYNSKLDKKRGGLFGRRKKSKKHSFARKALSTAVLFKVLGAIL